MNKYLLWIFYLIIFISNLSVAQDKYPKDPDSQVQENVPKGEIIDLQFSNSKIFPGTIRTYSIYVPAQYKPEQAACLYVNLDGIQFNSPTVFDNLIHKGELPVIIGVFVGSGVIYKEDGKSVLRYNRSYEFDGVNNNFGKFLLEELLPEVEKQKTKDGRIIRISKSGNDHAIAGLSSGGIGAFKTAWERPDQFSRIFSGIGTFVGMRGGDRYPILVRKTEPKPLRIFLQDGSNDVWNPLFGDWYMGNLNLEAALSFAGYEVDHAWGDEWHNDIHATAIFPKVIKWLWKDWPAPVKSGTSKNDMLKSILIKEESWKLVEGEYSSAAGLAANQNGEVFFNNGHTISKINSDGKITEFAKSLPEEKMLAFDPEGKLITAGKETIFMYGADGSKKVTAKKFLVNDFLVTDKGDMYFTKAGANTGQQSKIWLVKKDGSRIVVDTGMHHVAGLAIFPDKSLLFVAEGKTQWIYSYVISTDGTLKYKQRFYWLHVSESGTDAGDMPGATALAMDQSGLLYVATNMGIQVCDRNGRVRAILPLPSGPATALCFGGEKSDTLFVISGGKIYKRKLNVHGNQFWARPVAVPEGSGG